MEAPILLFDGHCNLCNASVQWVLRRDKSGRFRFASLQSDFGRQLMHTHGLDADRLDTVVLIVGGKVYLRSDAPLEVARHIGGVWRWLYPFRLIPPFIRDAVYRFIARNRYRWFGRNEVCWLPRPEWKDRFLG